MKAYLIHVPYTSQNLRVTYRKKMEVFECECSKNVARNRYQVDKIISLHVTQTPKLDDWDVRSPCEFHDRQFTTLLSSLSDIPRHGKVFAFTTLELAKAAKMMLIDNMNSEYAKEIEHIEETRKRNVPDVSAVLDDIYQRFPEHFV